MRHLSLLSLLLFLPVAAWAQNYVPPERYNNPDVIVNLDVLAGSGVSSAPVYNEILPAPMPPVVLTPPKQRAAQPQSDLPRQLLAQARAEVEQEDKTMAVEPNITAPAPRAEILFDGQEAESIDKPVTSENLPQAASKEVLPMPSQDELTAPPMALMPAPQTENTVSEVVSDEFEAYRLFFESKSSQLNPKEQAVLDGLIAKLKRDEAISVQILAYAAGTPDTASQSRRLSLARALAVRSSMIQDGIVASRINVRAMGMGEAGVADRQQPADRVDIVFEK